MKTIDRREQQPEGLSIDAVERPIPAFQDFPLGAAR
jgi:hypothetical protein